MAEQSKPGKTETKQAPISFVEFLETSPPGAWVDVTELSRFNRGGTRCINEPDIQLHCGSEHCGGTRFFACVGSDQYFVETVKQFFLIYQCRNCGKSSKIFALYLGRKEGTEDGKALKFGEWPLFGPPTPSRLISLVGPDRDLFLKGRRAENQGLGIGAFGYYRRVVENQKNRLLDEIIRVAEKTRAKANTIAALRAAQEEAQFSKAVDMVKDAIPESLLIDSHNPLTLLHSALSEGLHAKSDEECLQLATSIRVVLQELADRASVALKDHAELKSAVARLLDRGSSSDAG